MNNESKSDQVKFWLDVADYMGLCDGDTARFVKARQIVYKEIVLNFETLAAEPSHIVNLHGILPLSASSLNAKQLYLLLQMNQFLPDTVGMEVGVEGDQIILFEVDTQDTARTVAFLAKSLFSVAEEILQRLNIFDVVLPISATLEA